MTPGQSQQVRRRRTSVLDRALAAAMFHVELLASRAGAFLGRRFVRGAGAPATRVHTFTAQDELAALARLAMQVPPGVAALEIGSYLGASARFLVAGLSRRGSRLYCVDTWNNETMPDGQRDTLAEFRANLGPLVEWVVLVRKPSAALTARDVPEPIGLAFIDGDHGYRAVKTDLEVVLPLLTTEDPIIAFHDCMTWEGVSRVIGEAVASGDWILGGQAGNLAWLRRAPWKRRSSDNLKAGAASHSAAAASCSM